MVEEGTISKEDLDLFTYTDDPQVAWATIKSFYKLS
jgi:predicted Rossmann-fold nucleotide-binding protein